MTEKRRYIDKQPGTKNGRRPGDKPVIHRGSNMFLFFHRFTSDFLRSCLRGNIQDNVPRCPGSKWNDCVLSPGLTNAFASCRARSRPAPPPCFAPPCTDLPMVCPGLDATNFKCTCPLQSIFIISNRKI